MLRLDPTAAAAKAETVLPKIREDPATGVTVDNLKHFGTAAAAPLPSALRSFILCTKRLSHSHFPTAPLSSRDEL